MSRPSPPESANKFDSFTIKKGTDNNIWINVPDKNKINKWHKFCEVLLKDSKIISIKLNFKLIHYIFGIIAKKHTFKYLGELNIIKNIELGDSIYFLFKNYGSVKYYIYRYN